jgi:antitoxin component HigA of HigAB toxin-antitoxin module
MTTSLDRILATLNAAEVGSIERIAERMRIVATDLRAIEQEDLAKKADDSVAALIRADVSEFKRLRAFIQSKVGHLR